MLARADLFYPTGLERSRNALADEADDDERPPSAAEIAATWPPLLRWDRALAAQPPSGAPALVVATPGAAAAWAQCVWGGALGPDGAAVAIGSLRLPAKRLERLGPRAG